MGRAYQNRKESMAKTSDMKARVYSKYAREIYVSAKSGGVDPAGNLALRSIIDRAKKDQVPTHVIDKAIDKAKGGAGEDFAVARYEGFGLPPIEAMARGRPVVATAVGALPDLVGDGAILVDPTDRAGLGRALRGLWHDPEHRSELGRAGRRAAGRLGWHATAAGTLDVYRRLGIGV